MMMFHTLKGYCIPRIIPTKNNNSNINKQFHYIDDIDDSTTNPSTNTVISDLDDNVSERSDSKYYLKPFISLLLKNNNNMFEVNTPTHVHDPRILLYLLSELSFEYADNRNTITLPLMHDDNNYTKNNSSENNKTYLTNHRNRSVTDNNDNVDNEYNTYHVGDYMNHFLQVSSEPDQTISNELNHKTNTATTSTTDHFDIIPMMMVSSSLKDSENNNNENNTYGLSDSQLKNDDNSSKTDHEQNDFNEQNEMSISDDVPSGGEIISIHSIESNVVSDRNVNHNAANSKPEDNVLESVSIGREEQPFIHEDIEPPKAKINVQEARSIIIDVSNEGKEDYDMLLKQQEQLFNEKLNALNAANTAKTLALQEAHLNQIDVMQRELVEMKARELDVLSQEKSLFDEKLNTLNAANTSKTLALQEAHLNEIAIIQREVEEMKNRELDVLSQHENTMEAKFQSIINNMKEKHDNEMQTYKITCDNERITVTTESNSKIGKQEEAFIKVLEELHDTLSLLETERQMHESKLCELKVHYETLMNNQEKLLTDKFHKLEVDNNTNTLATKEYHSKEIIRIQNEIEMSKAQELEKAIQDTAKTVSFRLHTKFQSVVEEMKVNHTNELESYKNELERYKIAKESTSELNLIEIPSREASLELENSNNLVASLKEQLKSSELQMVEKQNELETFKIQMETKYNDLRIQNNVLQKDIGDYTKKIVQMDYLKGVIVKCLSFQTGSDEWHRLVPVLASILHFDDSDLKIIEGGALNKNSWFIPTLITSSSSKHGTK